MKLNLGCGTNLFPQADGWVNVDKYGEPDVRLDLETTPWPWDDSSVDEVALVHVLEHLCPTPDSYRDLWREVYRVCKDGATVLVVVPDPKSDDFLDDPTHIRAVTPRQFSLFSMKNCDVFRDQKVANSQLARYWGIDFDVVGVDYTPSPLYMEANPAKRDSTLWLGKEAATKWNQVAQTSILLRAVKP